MSNIMANLGPSSVAPSTQMTSTHMASTQMTGINTAGVLSKKRKVTSTANITKIGQQSQQLSRIKGKINKEVLAAKTGQNASTSQKKLTKTAPQTEDETLKVLIQ